LGVPYEIVIRFRRAVSRRYLVNGLAVQHKRHRDVATHTKLLDSRRLGRSAEGKIDRCAEAGANDRNLPPGNRLFNRSIAGVRAEYSLGEDCQLERSASSCNGGCETSYRVGNAPWVGCSHSSEIYIGNFSSTCRDTLSYNTYAQCVDTKALLGATPRESRWICSSLLTAGKLPGEKQVAEGRR